MVDDEPEAVELVEFNLKQAGFGVLTLSRFQMTSHLGWLSVLIVATAPIADLVVAPALLMALERRAAVSDSSTSIGVPAGKVVT